MINSMFIQLERISKSYGDPGTRIHRKVLEDLDLGVEEGEGLAIIGPSGSGKTTLLNLLGSLDVPDSGSIRIGDKDLSDLNAREIAAFRNRSIGFVFQSHFLLPQCNIWENVLVPVLPAGKPGKEVLDRAEDLLKQTGLWELRWQKPSQLSGGECQRTAVVRALINRPALLLADEPTGALDEENAGMIMELLARINRETGVTTIVITHSADLAGMMGRILRLKNGKLEKVR
jgi:ABC-type lipoprotein export system ATPase subunit